MLNRIVLYAVSLPVGYLIGSISFARLIFAKLKPGCEPERLRTPTKDGKAELVSHAIGATNVMMAFGPRWGMLATALDIMKAFLPVLALRIVFPGEYYHLTLATAILAGHLWPVWYTFVGGGGNSCIIGMLLAVSPLGVLVTHAGGVIIGKITPVFAFLGGVGLTIPWFVFRNGIFSPETGFALVIFLLYLAGQLPEAREYNRLKRLGYELDSGHVMDVMRRSAATGRPGVEVSGTGECPQACENENTTEPGGHAGSHSEGAGDGELPSE